MCVAKNLHVCGKVDWLGLPIALSNTLELVLLLDGIRIGRALGGIDQFVSEALGNGLDVAEGRFTGAGGEQSN